MPSSANPSGEFASIGTRWVAHNILDAIFAVVTGFVFLLIVAIVLSIILVLDGKYTAEEENVVGSIGATFFFVG